MAWYDNVQSAQMGSGRKWNTRIDLVKLELQFGFGPWQGGDALAPNVDVVIEFVAEVDAPRGTWLILRTWRVLCIPVDACIYSYKPEWSSPVLHHTCVLCMYACGQNRNAAHITYNFAFSVESITRYTNYMEVWNVKPLSAVGFNIYSIVDEGCIRAKTNQVVINDYY